MSVVHFKRNEMVMVVSDIDSDGDMQFYIYDEDSLHGANAATYLSTAQVQELIKHLNECLLHQPPLSTQ